MIAQLFAISLAAILVENFVLVQFMGICPFLGVSKKVETALGMGIAVTFVMAISNLLTFIIQKYILILQEIQMNNIPDFANWVRILSGSGLPYEAAGDSHQWKDQKW